MTAEVRVEGLDELARELKRIDPALTKQLRLANKTVSDKMGHPSPSGHPGSPLTGRIHRHRGSHRPGHP